MIWIYLVIIGYIVIGDFISDEPMNCKIKVHPLAWVMFYGYISSFSSFFILWHYHVLYKALEPNKIPLSIVVVIFTYLFFYFIWIVQPRWAKEDAENMNKNPNNPDDVEDVNNDMWI